VTTYAQPPMPAAELQPRLRPRSRTAADQRVGVMRLYYTGASPENLKRARQHAPSHSHGYGWTPAKMTPHDAPYFLDNGAFTDHFDADAWVETVERALIEMPRSPDFLVLPDVYGAAEATIQRHREWLYDRSMGVGSGQCMRYWVLQPGLPIPEQFEAIEGCQGVFVGGTTRWKRAHAAEIVRLADEHDLRTHVGCPGGANGLVWAYRQGFDSADTTTVFQNQYWHYLDRLEEATAETQPIEPERAAEQASIDGWA